MWRRLARRTFGAAGRPAIFPEQWPLVVVTALAIVGGFTVVVWALTT